MELKVYDSDADMPLEVGFSGLEDRKAIVTWKSNKLSKTGGAHGLQYTRLTNRGRADKYSGSKITKTGSRMTHMMIETSNKTGNKIAEIQTLTEDDEPISQNAQLCVF